MGTATNSLPLMAQETKHLALKRMGWLYPIFRPRTASYFPAQNTRSARGGDCHQFRAFKESTTYGRIRTRNWLTVPSHHAVSPFCAGK